MRSSKPITITLGNQRKSLESHLDSGDYEEAAFDEIIKAKIREALDDPRAPIPENEVFDRLELRYKKMIKDS